MEMGRERDWEMCAHSAPASFFSVSTSGCRRAASFPFFGETTIQPSSLKARSQSESEGLNKIRYSQVKFETLRQRLDNTIEENEEGSDYGSKHSSSSSECGADDAEVDIFCAGPLDEDLPEFQEEVSIRKGVRFADDCGQDLFTVRIATEPSDCPPRLSPSVLRRYRGDSFEEEHHEQAPVWNLLFKQPAAEYVRFREKLEKDKVSLENVIVQNEAYKVVGTVKVANIAFEKTVFIRYSLNGWLSYMDKPATFQPSTSKVYDTFKFEIELPRCVERVHKIEFCVCYTASTVEHWDSNGGTNYQLECEQYVPERRTSFTGRGNYSTKFLDRDDAYKLDYNDWGKFASWKNLSTDGPYW